MGMLSNIWKDQEGERETECERESSRKTEKRGRRKILKG